MRKFSLEDIKTYTKEITNNEYICISSEYVNCDTPVEFKCNKGHIFKKSWTNFQQGQRCHFCSNSRIEFNSLKRIAEENGIHCISKEYNSHLLEFVCSEGHVFRKRPWRFLESQTCNICSGHVKKTLEDIKFFVSNQYQGWELLSTEFVKSSEKLILKCPKGHINNIRWDDIRSHHTKCRQCSIENRTGNNHYNWKGGPAYTRYDTYADKISWCEEVIRDPEDTNILQVKCTYCGKWYRPTTRSVEERIRAITGKTAGENRLYCSEECKTLCPIFRKRYYSAEETNTKQMSREVQPQLRQMVFERDNWTCVKCKNNRELQCHHVEGIRWEPLTSADMDMCVTLCGTCHEEVHKIEGCTTADMRCI